MKSGGKNESKATVFGAVASCIVRAVNIPMEALGTVQEY
jgi:hypothetical protein